MIQYGLSCSKRLKITLLLVISLVFGMLTPAYGVEGTSSAYQATNANNLDGHMSHLTNTIGARLMGSDNEKLAADYILAQFKAAGYSNAEMKSFALPTASTAGAVKLQGGKELYTNLYFNGTSKTPFAVASPGVVDGGTLDALVTTTAAAKVVLLDVTAAITTTTTTTTTSSSLTVTDAKLVSALNTLRTSGAAAVIMYHKTQGVEAKLPSVANTFAPSLPVLVMTYKQVQQIQNASSITHVKSINKTTSYNVMAIKPSTTTTQAIIHVTAHFDSVHIADGASDNASGAAALIELARVYKNVDTKGIELRFVAVGAEEGGLNGSKAYVASLTPEEKAISINLNMDMLGTSWADADVVSMDIPGRTTATPTLNLPAALVITASKELEPWLPGTKNVRMYGYGGSDHVSFYNGGMDAASMIRATEEDDDIEPINHSTDDTYNNNYSKDRLHEATNMMSKAIARAIDLGLTKRIDCAIDAKGNVTVNNASQLKGLYSSIKVTLTPKVGESVTFTAEAAHNFSFVVPAGSYTMSIAGVGVGTSNVKGTLGNTEVAKTATFTTVLASNLTAVEVAGNSNDGGSSRPSRGNSGSGSAVTSKTQAAVSDIAKAKAGDTVTVTMGTSGSVPVEVLSAAKGKDVNIVFNYNGYTWTINGLTIKDMPANMKDIGLAISTMKSEQYSEMAQGKDILQIEIDHSGELPFTASLAYSIGDAYDDSDVYLYFVNEKTDSLEYVAASTCKNGKVVYDFDHASKYVLTAEKLDETVTKEETTVKASSPYSDVNTSDWFYDAVMTMHEEGLVYGVGEGKFAPNGTMTRAMFAAVLARLDGANLSGYTTSPFADVDSKAWYGSSVAWVAKQGIMGGYDNGNFGPNDPITREQMAVILANYLKVNGITLAQKNAGATVNDMDSVSAWAKDAVADMLGYGIISGMGNNKYEPKNTATRAQVAQVFMNLINAME